MADYALEGEKWGSPTLGTAGGTVTWAVDASVPGYFAADLAAAFSSWSSVGNIAFAQVGSTANASIDFSLGSIDGRSRTLGVTNYSFSGGSLLDAKITFDSAEGWHQVGGNVLSSDGLDLLPVALHEIGHAIGLDHYNASAAIMNSVLGRANTGLTGSDIDGIVAIYGTAPASSAPDALVDDAFYLRRYPDVLAAAVDPDQHYPQFGWREGRDPDAFFSTIGYRAANPDVAAAGINPLVHYDTYGWKEGRDPSAAFDDQLYLERNPDVRAAGIDPLAHYLQYGQAEGRAAYAAVGFSGDFKHGSFDAEFYLLANPDVARAALQAGGDSFAFAYRHYEDFGWHEGRNPNSVFDVAGYLARYADVRAAGMDPLTHYDTYGWHEGRDPSAHFDTARYESQYADVAAAGTNPLTHYLAYGIHEGRLPFDDGHLG